MNIADWIGKQLRDRFPSLFDEEEVRLEPQRSGLVNIFDGTTGWRIAGKCFERLLDRGIYPSFHIIASEEDGLPYDENVLPRTLLDNTGGGKLYSAFNSIAKSNRVKMGSDLDRHPETVAILFATAMGGTGATSDTVAAVNRERGRAVLTVLSISDGNYTTNGVENIVDNVNGFLQHRKKLGGMMEVFKPATPYETAMEEIENFCLLVNNSAVQKFLNPRDIRSIVEKHAFGTMISERVSVPYKTNPSHLYDKMLGKVRSLKEKGFLNERNIELLVFIEGPPDVFSYKDAVVGYVIEAFEELKIPVKGVFEPFLSYVYSPSNKYRDLWVHVVAPVDMKKYCRKVLGEGSGRRRKNAK